VRKIYSLDPDGSRRPLSASGLLVRFSDGRLLEFGMGPPQPGRIGIRADFDGPLGIAGAAPGRLPEVVSSLVLHPGAGNVARITVESRSRSDRRLVAGDSIAADVAAKSYFAISQAGRTPAVGQGFLFDLGEERLLHVDSLWPRSTEGVTLFAGPLSNTASRDAAREGGPIVSSQLMVTFGGCNVAYVFVSPPHAAMPITRADSA
jgi:hypothetical protein